MKRRDAIKNSSIAVSNSILSPRLNIAFGKASAAEHTKKRPGETVECNPSLINRLLEAIEQEIVPLTQQGVKQGNKLFGAGMLRKSDLSTIIVGTNNETENPLFHGEVSYFAFNFLMRLHGSREQGAGRQRISSSFSYESHMSIRCVQAYLAVWCQRLFPWLINRILVFASPSV